MKRIHIFALILLVVVSFNAACSKQQLVTETEASSVPSLPSRSDEIIKAEALIEKLPDSPLGYRALGAAYVRIGRESGDPEKNKLALESIEKGLAKSPNDPILKKLKATILLSDHRFKEAREIGIGLEKESPKDAFVLGILTDANAELGDYDAATKYAQRMVDARPDSTSYSRAAHLRSLYGDYEGSVEMYILAARTADPADVEARAWCLSQLGNEYWKNGKYAESQRTYEEALQIMPGYHHALYGKGRTLASTGDLAGAKTDLFAAQAKAPAIDTVLLLGDVYRKLGETENAEKQFAMAEGGEERLGGHYDEHRMALFWADQDKNLDRALEVAIADYAEIKDIYASDILAWCYYKKGNFAKAKEQITKAMRLKTRDARIYYHAGMIELALGNKAEAKKHLTFALELNPQFDLFKAESARTALNGMV